MLQTKTTTREHRDSIAIRVRPELEKEIGHDFHKRGPAWTLLVDDKAIAAGGHYLDQDGPLGPERRIWCITTDETSRYKMAFMRRARYLIWHAFNHTNATALVAYTFTDYDRSTEVSRMLGFSVTHLAEYKRIKTVRYQLRRDEWVAQQHSR